MTQMNLAMKQKQAHRHRTDLRLPGAGREVEGWIGGLGQQMQTIIHRVDEQQGPTM